MIFPRASGILLHPTSLPGPDGIGDLGPEAYRWVDFLKASGTQIWQVLPLGPTGYGDSPYQCFSAFAGNPYLISPLLLLEDGLLDLADLKARPLLPADRVDFGPTIIWKTELVNRAFSHYKKNANPNIKGDFEKFQIENKFWLADFSVFMAIKESQNGSPWNLWPRELKFREADALNDINNFLSDAILKYQFEQFLFFRQWNRLHQYAKRQGVQILGDMPFVIALDSADVWANPDLFLLDSELTPTLVAGVPPDYFSVTGQLWGNPLYRWENHISQNFKWWVDRLGSVLKQVDLVRLDHFRGFSAAWHVPYGEKTAINGHWLPGPAMQLFETFHKNFPAMPIIAEDLGVITEDVENLRDRFNLPGMKILQFAFGGDPEDDFLPHHYPINCFAYTGSHDNDTAQGWYNNANPREQKFCRSYLNCSENEIAWGMMRAIWQSVAATVVAPMQDLLSLDSSARMNLPGSESGNWTWRMPSDALDETLKGRLRNMNFLYSRLPAAEKMEFTKKLNQDLAGSVKPH